MHLKGIKKKDSRWLSAVGSIEYCVLCGSTEILQVAHVNERRGKGQKSPDWMTARLCRSCHHDIDNGHLMTQIERRYRMNLAVVLTHSILVSRRILVISSDDNDINEHS